MAKPMPEDINGEAGSQEYTVITGIMWSWSNVKFKHMVLCFNHQTPLAVLYQFQDLCEKQNLSFVKMSIIIVRVHVTFVENDDNYLSDLSST